MFRRSYKKYMEVYAELSGYCAVNSGNLLASERELSHQFNTSRMTLRKALEEARNNGLIRSENHHNLILSPRSLRKLGKIIFIAGGTYNQVHLGAMNRLWSALKLALLQRDADIELVLSNSRTSCDELSERCAGADIILPSVFLFKNFDPSLEFLRKFQSHKKIIALSDPHLEFFSEYIALDNHAAGSLAAQALFQCGCRRAAFVSTFTESNIICSKRKEGFMQTFQEKGGELLIYDSPKKEDQIIDQCRREIDHALEKKCDSLFLPTDEGIGFITAPLFEHSLIPDHIKLISLNGSGEALMHQPPIACINHGTNGVIQILIAYLETLASSPTPPAPIQKLITPDLYFSPTLGTPENLQEFIKSDLKNQKGDNHVKMQQN